MDEVHGQRRIRRRWGRGGAPTPPPGQPTEQDLADSARFFSHELRHTTRYLPDSVALTTGSTRVVIGLGAASGALITHSTSTALAERLGTRPVEFPGDHGGFVGQPKEFADTLRKVLTSG